MVFDICVLIFLVFIILLIIVFFEVMCIINLSRNRYYWNVYYYKGLYLKMICRWKRIKKFLFVFNFLFEYFEVDVMCNIFYSKYELCGCIIR